MTEKKYYQIELHTTKLVEAKSFEEAKIKIEKICNDDFNPMQLGNVYEVPYSNNTIWVSERKLITEQLNL
tara:strand:- start:1233 stop:1442 length:210 start_codon:yes stop_codon:yes gene_type:complete